MHGMDMASHLRSAGYRMTPQRQLVWDVLRSSGAHLSAEQIQHEISRTVPDFNAASVYRTLRLLEDLGLVSEVQLGDGRGYWELAHTDEVIHLHCRRCGTVDHHGGAMVAEVKAHLGTSHGFTTEAVDVVAHGVCARCR